MTAGREAPVREVPGSGSEDPPAAGGGDAGRAIGLRLARVHLCVGSLPLARAELEAYAGRGALDEDALLDLAEVRWRTGDLAGAGEAANALLGRGREDPLALVIAAEAVAALGRPGEARRLAGRALEAVDGPLDPIFAGMPRSLIWPGDTAPRGGPGADADEPIAAVHPRSTGVGAGVVVPGAGPEGNAPASAAAAEAFAGGLAALGAADVATASLRLGVALRLEPSFAQGVLDALGGRAGEPALALVAGDALRLLGRETEALAAFDRARGHAPDA
jgi:tetratricopeptide (TPR) repeat protein